MATWRHTSQLVGAQPIQTADTVKNHAFGTIVTAQDTTLGAGEFIYLKGVASTLVGSWVGYSPASGVSILAIANGNYPLGVAMSVCDTTTKFGWYQISGLATAIGLTSITSTSGFLALTSTAGQVDDASVIGDHIFNAHKTATVHVVGTFLDTYNLARPFSGNIVTVRN